MDNQYKTMSEENRKGTIENWHEVNWFKQTRVVGNVHDCDAFEEGEQMMTSEIVKYDTVFGQLVVETASGSIYILGIPAKEDKTIEQVFSEYKS